MYIAIGGGIGALLRHLASRFINSAVNVEFSSGVLFVNCVGALLIGFLANAFDAFALNVKWRMFLITGFLGGYTTFSTYSLETVQYFLDGRVKHAIANILLNNVLCMFLALSGIWLSKAIFTR